MNNILEIRENKILFLLLSNQLFKTKYDIPLDDIDYKKIFEETKKQTVSTLAFYALPDKFEEKYPRIYNEWMNLTMTFISKNTQLYYANFELAKLLEKNNIKYCIIKGIVSSKYYPDPKIRIMGDIDFIISPVDMERADKVLQDNGYKRSENSESHDLHIAYNKNNISFEMHYKFIDNDTEESLQFTEDILNNSIQYQIDPIGKVSVADDFRHCLIMLYHMKRHMVASGMGLRHLYDWAVFVEKYSDEEFVETFKEEIQKRNLWKFAQAITKICSKYLGLKEKTWANDADEDLIDNLFNYIYSTGNFGSKADSFDDLFIRNTNKNSNPISQLIHSLNLITIRHWPKAKTNVFIRCVGFVWFPIRYCFRMLIGKKEKVNVADTLKSGRNTNNTFKQLNIYQDKK